MSLSATVEATQQDEQTIQEWLEKRCPEIKEKAEKEGYTILFVDESAIYLLPGVVYTWAPKGETPLLRVPPSRKYYSAISAVSRAKNLYKHIELGNGYHGSKPWR